jgi:polysaccharide biosynthesis/export protein
MRSFYFILLLVLGASCISNKKVQYLQRGDVNKHDLPLDSVVRSYTTIPFIYRIQPHDALFINFESSTEESFDFLANDQAGGGNVNNPNAVGLNADLVDEQGDITIPVIGKVKVAGLTIFEIQDKLQGIASQFLDGTKVRVRLVNFRFTVLGEVNQEGNITTMNNRVTLPEAIGLAGGIGELADRAQVKIIRQRGDSVEVAYVDLLSEDLIHSPFYYIHQNDILIVPPLQQRPFRKYFGQNLSLFISSLSLLLLVYNLR